MSENKSSPFFVGEFPRPVDGAGRVTIPSQWRLKGEDARYLAIPLPDGTARVLPPCRIQELQEKVAEQAKLSDLDGHRALTAIFAKSDLLECDKQGRVVLSERIRGHVGILKGKSPKAMLTGNLNTFTIWNSKNYADSGSLEDAALMANLAKLGV